MQEKVPDRGERKKARPGILLSALLGLKGPRGKEQRMGGQWYDVHEAMFGRDNIPGGPGQGDQCSRCANTAAQVRWQVLRMTALALPTTNMRTTDVRGQWWVPGQRLPREVHDEEEVQLDMEIFRGGAHERNRAGVRIGCPRGPGPTSDARLQRKSLVLLHFRIVQLSLNVCILPTFEFLSHHRSFNQPHLLLIGMACLSNARWIFSHLYYSPPIMALSTEEAMWCKIVSGTFKFVSTLDSTL